jgi:cytochrome c5
VLKKVGQVLLTVLLLAFVSIAALVTAYVMHWYAQPRPGHVKDEALLAGRDAASFVASDVDYFHDMDGGIDLKALAPDKDKLALIRGRNTWIVWTAGDDRLWNQLIYRSAGALDFLKVLSTHPELKKINPNFRHDKRWEYLGLANDPCFEEAQGPDPERWGLWLDKRRAGCTPDPFEDESKYPGVKIGSRGTKLNGRDFPVGSYYGYETGIVGMRLFPNPDFDAEAAQHWDPVRYYTDKSYYEDKKLVRPYRVGMSCGFCHVGPNPLKPPKDPDNPQWENLSSNVGAQYFWIDRIFYWEGEQDNFVWQLFHTSRPGSLDTSLVSTDSINNPRTMNAVYMLKERLEHATRWGKETLSGGQRNNKQFNDYIPVDNSGAGNETEKQREEQRLDTYYHPPDTVWTPRVLKDGSDSVGALGALNRVYLNIGTFSEEWLLHFNALVGGKPISPIEISVARKNSAYFAATEAQTPAMALFFLKSTEPHHLEDLRKTDADARKALDSDEALVPRGKEVFAERCARCHSSKLPEFPPDVAANAMDEGRGCGGKNYLDCWSKYWAWTQTYGFREKMTEMVKQPDFLEHNYLSTELRIPVTLLETNACSPLATNALADNIWDNFSSQSYKELPSVGTITWYHPYSGEARSYQMPAGGRGYTRPPSLVSLWSTAPYLLNNSVGKFNADPSVKGRLDSFQNSIEQLLWPERREKDEFLGDRIPGKIDRTTQESYLRISDGYLPDALTKLPRLARVLPDSITHENGMIQIGPIPKGTPVGLLTNLMLLSESTDPAERLRHDNKLFSLALKIGGDLKKLPKDASDEERRKVFSNVVDPLLELSKCPDLIVNRGHYFGTDKFTGGEPGLSDADKHALIAFLKRF